MDPVDRAILTLLKDNGRLTYSDLGRRVHLSVPAVAERVRRLESSGVIDSYTVRLNRNKLNCGLLSFVMVTIERAGQIDDFREKVVEFAEVLECHHIAGEYDYLLKVAVADTAALERFLSVSLKKIEGVVKTNTLIVLSTLKEGS
ncbi:MAG: Lrp/AsnC family transcriptional regulator [Bacillota bacterium]